ncbi:MAG: hypothetical protein KIS78_01480, partial [Labilithrix sp.]|nr:hypothetical protein [Labilithrix sp.]
MSWQLKVGPWVLGGRWGSVSRPRAAAAKAARISHLRPSLRTNALLMALAMLALPQLIVVGWSLMERDIGGKLQWEAKTSADEAAEALAASSALAGAPAERPLDEGATREIEARLDEIATRWGTRVRVIDEEGLTRFDADADRNTDLVHQIGTLFFGPDGAPTLRELDETLGPVPKRGEVVKATGWATPDAPAPRSLPEGSGHVYPFVPAPAPDDGSAAPVSTAFRERAPPLDGTAVVTGCRTSPAGTL